MQEQIKEFKKVLVANRGEIAIRVFRALNELGIQSVCVFSKEDKYSAFRTKADESYKLNPNKGPIDAYLDINEIIKIAKERNVDAIHPGYGLLSENPEFVEACEKNGITFIGPTVATMNAMGDKISSKQIAIKCGVPIIPGVDHALKSLEEVTEIAEKIGYPVMLKASNGGGGRGMRIVNCAEDMPREFEEAKNEAKKAFGDDKIFIEKYLKSPKHIEVQVMGDKYGNVIHLFDRDCSVQRRHQKVVEFAPADSISYETRRRIFSDAVKLSKYVGYSNAGTLEFLVDANENYYFIEMNPRIQVEHTVTEMTLLQHRYLLPKVTAFSRKKSALSHRRIFVATVMQFSFELQQKTLQTTSFPIQERLRFTVHLPETVSDLTVVTYLPEQRLHLITTAFLLRSLHMTVHLKEQYVSA